MEKLSRYQVVTIRKTPFEGNRETGTELEQGWIHQHIPAEQPYARLESGGRFICDVILLGTLHEDGSADITITHFVPNELQKLGTTLVVNAMRQKRHGQGKRFATILTGHPYTAYHQDMYDAYDALYASVKEFNDGIDPDVVIVKPTDIRKRSDLVFERVLVDGKPLCNISVTNNPYSKQFDQNGN